VDAGAGPAARTGEPGAPDDRATRGIGLAVCVRLWQVFPFALSSGRLIAVWIVLVLVAGSSTSVIEGGSGPGARHRGSGGPSTVCRPSLKDTLPDHLPPGRGDGQGETLGDRRASPGRRRRDGAEVTGEQCTVPCCGFGRRQPAPPSRRCRVPPRAPGRRRRPGRPCRAWRRSRTRCCARSSRLARAGAR
jgi:hypothetical protein